MSKMDDIRAIQAEDTFKAHVSKIVFKSDDGDFYIAELTHGETRFSAKFNSLSAIAVGSQLLCDGRWGEYRGEPQFTGKQIRASLSDEPKWLSVYLKETMNISPMSSVVWIERMGAEAFKTASAEELSKNGVPDRDAKRLEIFFKKALEQDIAGKLQELGIPDDKIKAVIDFYGKEDIVNKIKEDPYRLMNIDGMYFNVVDKIGLDAGHDKLDPKRIGAGMMEILIMHAEDGHSHYPANDTVKDGMQMLGIEGKFIVDAILKGEAPGVVIEKSEAGGHRLYLSSLYHMEKECARMIAEMSVAKNRWLDVTDEEIIRIGREVTGFTLADEQVKGIKTVIESGFSLVTGGAGTGKTVVEATLVGLVLHKGLTPMIVAPTGKAAKRAEEVSGQPAETVHRAFGFDGQNWSKDEHDPVTGINVLNLDEFSMLTIETLYRTLKGMEKGVPLVMFGDYNQLESIGAGKVAYALTHTEGVNVAKLEAIKRTEGDESEIDGNAYRILDMKPIKSGNDVKVHTYEKDRIYVKELLKIVADRIEECGVDLDPVKDIQILVPRNGKVAVSVAKLNPKLRKLFNPASTLVQESLDRMVENGMMPVFPDHVFPTKDGGFYMAGDKVMKMSDNDKDNNLYNGDVGIVKSANKEHCVVQIGKRTITLSRKELASFDLAYAMTGHKSQGSEYKHVIVGMHAQHGRLLVNNLAYTMLTRGKVTVDIVDDGVGLNKAINTPPPPRFCTFGSRLSHQISMEIKRQESVQDLAPALG